jgi:hypothetical protein
LAVARPFEEGQKTTLFCWIVDKLVWQIAHAVSMRGIAISATQRCGEDLRYRAGGFPFF